MTCSRAVSSNQSGPHPRLAALVARHRAHPDRRPWPAPAAAALARLDAAVAAHRGPLVLDSGCGTGESSVLLATAHPAALVIAVDRSAARLARARRRARPPNVLFERLDVVDLWRWARWRRWPVALNYLLYPNPWPKQHQLPRRWHARAAMGDLLALGGDLELRTNWSVYAAEFVRALDAWTTAQATLERWQPTRPISAFERKYLASGHTLYRVRCPLTATAPS